MIYSNTLAAVVSALAAECIDNTTKQSWQKLIDMDPGAGGAGACASDRMQADCWVFARLHSQLIPRHWFALVARYSTHKARKVEAIGKVAPLVASPAKTLFVYKATTAWAIPQLRGAQGDGVKRSSDMIVLPASFYDMNTWDVTGAPESTRREWRRKVHAVLEEMTKEALASAETILQGEGVLLSVAA